MQDNREQDFLDPFDVVSLHLRIDSNTPRKWGGKAYRSKMPMRQERGGGREETKDHSLLTRPLTCIQPVIPFLWLFLNTCTTQASSPLSLTNNPSLPPSLHLSVRPAAQRQLFIGRLAMMNWCHASSLRGLMPCEAFTRLRCMCP